ncbi:MAG: Lipoprotein-releasing system ATP-binding protein LolD [Marine Group II euryarchaeote MED-G33]|jgi:putative ABC transport system ATP-binding protein|nr:MAG: Lipoprotein-releasing system ATP-binding protein LolD [Marine Group II euryarchaeote MED-G33]
MTTVLEALDLWKVYETGSNRVEALRKVSVSLEAGEMVAVMGPSGCGKTTLLNCLSGLDEITAGDVLIQDQALSQMSDYDLTALRGSQLGFIFQSFNLLPVLTAVENVELPLLMAGCSPREARERALAALEAVGLGERDGHLPSELSGGQQQRVTIARSFVHDPAVIFADEATGNLDSQTSDEIIDLLLNLNSERGVTMMLVTHDSEIADRCSRVLVMQDGRIVEDRRTGEEE